jgi:hypothetical protein
VPKFGEGTSSAAEAEQAAPIVQSVEEAAAVLKVSATSSTKVPIQTVEAEEEIAEKLDREEKAELLEAELPKVAKTPAITPKRRRMASVLDAVMETTRALTPAPARKVAEAATARAETEAEPPAPMKAEPAATERAELESLDTGIALEKDAAEKAEFPTPEAPSADSDFIIRHASGKKLSEEEIMEANHYARELKYPKGALVFNGTDEDDFLYCLPDNKEISVGMGDG